MHTAADRRGAAPLPGAARRRANEVIERLSRAGHKALLAGGCVRDHLLGRTPKDWDVATSARPEEVTSLFPKVTPVGRRFGVVFVVLGGTAIEVATFRRDSEYEDGRRPVSVTFSDSPEEDARRRDFTVNGLFLDPDGGGVLDFVGGRRDLEAGLVRAIGDPGERFDEDRLRMLRGVRFAANLDFEMELLTFRSIRRRAEEILSVSGERIREELKHILTGGSSRRGLELLSATGLMEAILPEVSAMIGVGQPPRFHPEGDVFTHTLVAVARLSGASFPLALATLLHDAGKPVTRRVAERVRFDRHAAVGADMAESIAVRLRLSREERALVGRLVRDHLKFMNVRSMRPSTLRRFLCSPASEDQLDLHRVDCLASQGDLSNLEFCRARQEEYSREPVRTPRLLTGHDLLDLGLPAGPLFAKILAESEDLVLEGRLKDRRKALEWAARRVRNARTREDGGPVMSSEDEDA